MSRLPPRSDLGGAHRDAAERITDGVVVARRDNAPGRGAGRRCRALRRARRPFTLVRRSQPPTPYSLIQRICSMTDSRLLRTLALSTSLLVPACAVESDSPGDLVPTGDSTVVH